MMERFVRTVSSTKSRLPTGLTGNKERPDKTNSKRPIGPAILDMQSAHTIHAYIALHKIRDRSYSAVIGSEAIRTVNQGAAYCKATEKREGELVERLA